MATSSRLRRYQCRSQRCRRRFRIGYNHQLPRPMKGHLTAALHAEERHRRGICWEQQVLLAAARTFVSEDWTF